MYIIFFTLVNMQVHLLWLAWFSIAHQTLFFPHLKESRIHSSIHTILLGCVLYSHWFHFQITLVPIPNTLLLWYPRCVHVYTVSKSYYSLLPNNLNSKTVWKALRVESLSQWFQSSCIISLSYHCEQEYPYKNKQSLCTNMPLVAIPLSCWT